METNNTNYAANQIQTIKSLRFGVELETVGISEKTAAEVVATVVGGTVEKKYDYPSGYSVVMADGRKWTSVHDGSIGDGSGRSAEVVSPILTWTDMDAVQNIARALRAAGAKVNDSCGMHVHVDGTAFKANPKKIVNLMAFATRYEDTVFAAAAAKRSGLNTWCAKLRAGRQPINVDAFKTVSTLNQAKLAWYGSEYSATYATGPHGLYAESRYHWLNLHALWRKGTVEFRIFDGTLHARKIKANIVLALSIAAAALCYKSVRWTAKATSVSALLSDKLCLTGDEFESARGHLLGRFNGACRAEVA